MSTRDPRLPVTNGSVEATAIELDQMTVITAMFPGGDFLSKHTHDRTNVVIMLRGGFALAIAGRTMDCHSGVLSVEPAGEPHSNRLGADGATVVVVQPRHALAGPLARCVSTLNSYKHHRDDTALALGRCLHQEVRHRDAYSTLSSEALATELMIRAARLKPDDRDPAPDWLPRVVEMLHAGQPLHLGLIAEEVGRHPAHVARVFRRHYGMSMGAWLRERRLEAAAARLKTTDETIGTIGASLGFADQSHFTRLFRRMFGATPGSYRREG